MTPKARHFQSPQPGVVVSLEGEISDSHFENAVVLLRPRVRLHNVVFRNCVFLFELEDGAPSPNQKAVSERLLASELRAVTISWWGDLFGFES